MRVGLNKLDRTIRKFQTGGEMAPQLEAPAEEAPMELGGPEQGGQDPLMQLAEMAMQALQSLDCNMAMQVCDGFVQLLQQAQGLQAPAEPTYQRYGGRLIRVR